MKQSIKQKKQTAKQIQQIYGENDFLLKMAEIAQIGKRSLDLMNQELGRMLVETILLMEREELAGPDYEPKEGYYKWAHQQGSVFIGDQKIKISKPRLRKSDKEVPLSVYGKLKDRSSFSEEVLLKAMSGLSARRYSETIENTAQAFGVSPSSISRHFIEATSKQLKDFLERDLSSFDPFAVLMDTVYRGGVAFVTALGISTTGEKLILGFWEGATENNEICKELLSDLEIRGIKLNSNIIFVTDGGKGILKCLRDKFGKKLLLQRCTIHKDHNLQKHVAKKYRQRVHDLFRKALNHRKHEDALKALEALEKELESISISAARSLREALPELLTLHRLEVPEELFKVLHTTNGIENLFSTVRHREHNIKNYNPEYRGKRRKGNISQRWLAAVFIDAEKNFRTVKGYKDIKKVIKNIEKIQTEFVDIKNKKAA